MVLHSAEKFLHCLSIVMFDIKVFYNTWPSDSTFTGASVLYCVNAVFIKIATVTLTATVAVMLKPPVSDDKMLIM